AKRVWLDDLVVEGDHSALIFASACSASYTVGAGTPTKSPSRMATTPGINSAALRSAETSLASCAGGRSTLPCSMPGKFMSEEYLCWPVTMARPSIFGVEVPRTFH